MFVRASSELNILKLKTIKNCLRKTVVWEVGWTGCIVNQVRSSIRYQLEWPHHRVFSRETSECGFHVGSVIVIVESCCNTWLYSQKYLSYTCSVVSSLILNVQVSRIHCFTLTGGKAEIQSGPYIWLKDCCTWWHNWEYSFVGNCVDNSVFERFDCKCNWVVEFMASHCRVFQQGFWKCL
jgi:hypothetical protein